MPKSTTHKFGRQQRHDAILELIGSHWIRSQAELQDLLDGKGIDANQATLSRDLRELGVVKGADGYELPTLTPPSRTNPTSNLETTVELWLTEVVTAGNQVVLKTPPGGAQPLARAIDVANHPLVLGTLGGDDTILVICADGRSANKLAQQLEDMR